MFLLNGDNLNTNVSDGYNTPDELEDQVEIVPPPIRDGDFSEFMWMENEDEFDVEVLRELEEQELMEQCLEDMLDEEEDNAAPIPTLPSDSNSNVASSGPPEQTQIHNSHLSNSESTTGRRIPTDNLFNSNRFSAQSRLARIRNNVNGVSTNSTNSNMENGHDNALASLANTINDLDINRNARVFLSDSSEGHHGDVASTLNPDAKEFVPVTRNKGDVTSENGEVPS